MPLPQLRAIRYEKRPLEEPGGLPAALCGVGTGCAVEPWKEVRAQVRKN